MPQNAFQLKREPTMRVFVYEYMTATGTGREPSSPDHGMYREGRAMRDAIVADFTRIVGVDVQTLPDDAPPYNDDFFLREVERSDRQVLIAPELGGYLLGQAILNATRGISLGSSSDVIRLTTDKLALADHWGVHMVRTPATTDREPTACEAFPVVWKPRDGAGSTDTFLIRDRFELAAIAARAFDHPMILQEFVSGRAASVAFLCGSRGHFPLLPCFQVLSADGRFKYEGGELPIPDDLAARAVALGRAAVECVPGLLGYVGVDLVLGDAPDGSRDYAIEINPRLTTAYIGLRALAAFNIAEAMLKAASGENVGSLEWKPGHVCFGPDGSVRFL